MALKRSGLTGRNSLAYLGVQPVSPPYMVSYIRPPTINDWESFHIGDLWLDSPNKSVWMLVILEDKVVGSYTKKEATWINIADDIPWLSYFVTEAGEAHPINSSINVFGGNGLNTTGSGNEVSILMDTGRIGQFLIGGWTEPVPGNLVDWNGSVSVANVGHNIHIDATTNVLKRLDGDSGYALPVDKFFTITGDLNITTLGGWVAPDELTVKLNDDVSISGTLTIVGFGVGVVRTDATGLLIYDNGTDGQTLIGGGTHPLWATITSTGGSIDVQFGPNSINLEVKNITTLNALGGDIGFAYDSPAGVVGIKGSTNITTAAGAGAGDELHISLNNSISLLGTLTLSALTPGVITSSATGVLSGSFGTDGKLFIAGTGVAPAWNLVTSTGGTIAFTLGSHSLGLECTSLSGSIQYIEDRIANQCWGVATDFPIQGYNNNNTFTLAVGSDLSVHLTNNVQVYRASVTPFVNGVVFSNNIGELSSSNGTNGQVIIGGGTEPKWASITSSDNSVNITPGVNSLGLDVKNPEYKSFAFNYCQLTQGSSGLGGTGSYSIGSAVALTKIFDDGNNFYPGNGAGTPARFTAPITGRYYLNMNIQFYCTDNARDWLQDISLRIITTARTYLHAITQSTFIPMGGLTRRFSACVDMTVGDTATFTCVADFGTGAGTITVNGDPIAVPKTWISGYIIKS